MKGSRFVLVLLTVFILMIVLLGPTSVQAAAGTYTASQNFPISLFVFIPCANAGVGEFVELTGSLHDVFSYTFDSAGGFRFTYSDNPQGITGLGWDTGAKYQGTGVTRGGFSGRTGYEETYVNNFRMIGQSTGNNFMVHETYHVTINANGTLTAWLDNFSVDCQ